MRCEMAHVASCSWGFNLLQQSLLCYLIIVPSPIVQVKKSDLILINHHALLNALNARIKIHPAVTVCSKPILIFNNTVKYVA